MAARRILISAAILCMTSLAAPNSEAATWSVHAGGQASIGPYFFRTQTAEADPEPLSFSFGLLTGGLSLEGEVGGRLDAGLDLTGYLGLLIETATTFAGGPPHADVSGGWGASAGARGLWGLEDDGTYYFADVGGMFWGHGGSQTLISAADNVFDTTPKVGPVFGAGLGYRTGSGVDLRARASVAGLFDGEASVFPVRLELQVGFGG